MPIYEYECSACGHKLEVLQKFSDQPITVCPKCQKTTLAKLISAVGFQLKGSGWYATDYRDKGTAAKKTESDSESGHKDTTTDTQKDTKKETKSSDSSSSNSSTDKTG